MHPIFLFWIVVVMVVGVVVLGYPIVRALASGLENRLSSGRPPGGDEGFEARQLRDLETRLSEVEREQGRLVERQEFVESLLEAKEPPPSLEPPE